MDKRRPCGSGRRGENEKEERRIKIPIIYAFCTRPHQLFNGEGGGGCPFINMIWILCMWLWWSTIYLDKLPFVNRSVREVKYLNIKSYSVVQNVHHSHRLLRYNIFHLVVYGCLDQRPSIMNFYSKFYRNTFSGNYSKLNGLIDEQTIEITGWHWKQCPCKGLIVAKRRRTAKKVVQK